MDEQQRRYLAEDAGDEAEALAPVVAALAAWDAPEPAADETARLVMRLQAEMVAGRPLADKRPFARLAGWWPWQLLRAQARVVQREIWWGSALVLALGVLVSVLLARAGET
ncbi:MAG: hypothetical protein KC425_17100, partial [Anaerolineales bacterium]|nr:hypothetical protein [Anaerolineales bacterium]